MSIDFSLRDPLPGVIAQLSHRWSPRAFAKTTIAPEVLARIIDAARFAPSCFNAQPWRFYTSNDTTFNDYLALLVDANQAWAKDAAVIGFLAAKKNFEHNGKPNAHSSFDSGAAWFSMVLQAQHEGFHCHGMAGLHKEAASEFFKLSESDDELIMAFAIGKIGNAADLPEALRSKEVPSPRKSLDEIWVDK
jgi:nitroreductase